jgi:hypothetical protein
MNSGFKDNNLNVTINTDEVKNLLKKYKKIKKYMKSSLYTIKTIDGNEKIVRDLLGDLNETDG